MLATDKKLEDNMKSIIPIQIKENLDHNKRY